MSGSYRIGVAMKARQQLERDLERYGLEQGLEMLKLHEREVGLGTREARAEAGFNIEQQRLAGGREVAEVRAGLEGARSRALDMERRYGRFSDLEAQRIERKGAIAQAGLSLREASAKAQATKADIRKEQKTYEVWLGDTARQINDWQLKNLPELPDFAAANTRNTMAHLIRIGAEVID